jgi:hypothetical protein
MAEGFINVQSPLMPNNDNPRGYVAENKYLKGAPQVFHSIEELVAFHPNRMKSGMPATVIDYPTAGTISDFRLSRDPSQMLNGTGNSIVTVDNFQDFWVLQSQTQKNTTRVYQFAPDGPGGGSPIYPYTPDEEDNWENVRDDAKGHKWMRFRDDDIDTDEDGIFDNWSVPIPIQGIFQTGDYVDERFRRQAVSATLHTGTGTMTTDKYYVVEDGRIEIDGDLSLNEIGSYGTVTHANLLKGRVFKFASGNTYSFEESATVTETLKAPPRTISGLPNNEPVGWDEVIPSGTDQLWQISGQKSVYGQLKSDWIIKKVNENPNYIRYSDNPSPHPNTIVGINTSAADGTGGDTALIAAGWSKTYDLQNFVATREDDPGPDLYTPWIVKKINEESGEYTDRVFKLFDLNLDSDSPEITPPTLRDATQEGWSDVPLEEGATTINYISEARKFFNGELKTAWSQPVPYTGKDTFSDTIEATPGDNFKYDAAGAVTPSTITLVSRLFKGLTDLSEDTTITSIAYVWTRVYNGGSIDSTVANSNSAEDFYFMGASSGAPGPGLYRNGQRLIVKPAGVEGQAVFRCLQTITTPTGTLEFEDEFTVYDVSDGIDAKSLDVTADNDRTTYDSDNTVFVPEEIVMRAYWANLISPTLKWYRYVGGVWTAISNGATYTIGGNVCRFDADALFAADGTAEELKFAVSTHATNPDSADNISTFSDYITIVKLGSSGLGSPGVNAVSLLLNNESHVVVLSTATEQPTAGEIGSSGKAKTRIQVYDGTEIQDFGTDYTIALESDNADVEFDSQSVARGGGNDAEVFVDVWNAGARSAICTITITYDSKTFTKKFSLGSTMDAPGAIMVDIDSDKGYIFTPSDKTNKTLTARLYDTSLTGSQEISLPDVEWTFKWTVAGVEDGAASTTNTKVVSRANVLVNAAVTVKVYRDSVLFRQHTINLSDVNDGRQYRAWTANATKPSTSQDLSNQDPTNAGIWPVTVSGVVWRLPTDSFWATNDPTYAQDGEDDGGSFSWTSVYRIKGEKGDQGSAGYTMHPMYRAADPGPPAFGAGGDTSTIAQMKTAGWTSIPPGTGVVWRTERMIPTQGLSYDSSLDPIISSALAVPVAGSKWAAAVRISAKDGAPGVGTAGNAGWSPRYGVVDRGAAEKVLQLLSWIGGTGTPPGNVGNYVGSSGFVSAINDAANIAGIPVELRYDSSSGYVQWKYTSEGSGSWRNLLALAKGYYVNGGSFNVFPAEQSITTGAGFITLDSVTFPAKPYKQKIKAYARLRVRSDSGDHDDNVELSFSTNFAQVDACDDYVRMRPMVRNGGEFETLQITSFWIVNAGVGGTVTFRVRQISGGGMVIGQGSIFLEADITE